MPQQSRRPDGSAKDDDWELRAVAIAARLDHAADELRKLIDELRTATHKGENPNG